MPLLYARGVYRVLARRDEDHPACVIVDIAGVPQHEAQGIDAARRWVDLRVDSVAKQAPQRSTPRIRR